MTDAVYCRKMTLRSYRNIENAEVSFSPGVNVIFGRNAQGKTNLLEAIYIFARGRRLPRVLRFLFVPRQVNEAFS